MKLSRDECGQSMIITALCMSVLCGMAGLAVDAGTLFRARRVLQTAADAAALAAAAEISYGDWSTMAKTVASLNGVTDGSNGYTVKASNPPSSGPHSTSSLYVEVVVSRSAPLYFMKLFGLNTMTVSARAVAGNGPSTGCIYTLDPSGIDVGLVGTGSLSMPDCGIIVNSSSSNAVDLTGVSKLTATSIGIVGNYVAGSNTTINPTPVTGIPPVSNPLGFVNAPSFTPSSCLADPKPSGGATIGPTNGGTVCYNGLTLNGSGTVTFNPGVYVLTAGMSSSGSMNVVQGTSTDPTAGVTIYLAAPNGSISLTGGGSLNLTAPTSGPYNGVLFYEDVNDTNVMVVHGNSGSTLTGIFYAPSATLNLTGTSGTTFYSDLVVQALSIAGTGTLQNYSGKNLNDPIQAARLVE